MRLRSIVIIFMFLFMINSAQAILYHDSKPQYADKDFLKPTEMIILETIEIFQVTVIVSMLVVTMLKVFGTYMLLKFNNPTIKFNPSFVISGLLGVFVGYTAFMGTNPVQDSTYIDLFMQAGFFALGSNLLFDFAGKVKGKMS